MAPYGPTCRSCPKDSSFEIVRPSRHSGSSPFSRSKTDRKTLGPDQETGEQQQDTDPAQGFGPQDNSRTASQARRARHEHGRRLPGWGSICRPTLPPHFWGAGAPQHKAGGLGGGRRLEFMHPYKILCPQDVAGTCWKAAGGLRGVVQLCLRRHPSRPPPLVPKSEGYKGRGWG